jgi:membrane-associated phospholipid phosphatase
MSIAVETKRRYAAAAFVTLLMLSVFWPSPVVSSNRLWFQADLDVDELSFLGREHPSWDVVFWFFAGTLLLLILHSAHSFSFELPRIQRPRWRHLFIGLAVGAALTLLVLFFLDMRALAWAEGVQSENTEDTIRIINRFGGGMNPVLIVAFFFIAGIAYAHRPWVAHAITMAIAGLTAGIAAQIVKHLVGRARPELWLGPMHYAPGNSTSFPSGHTVGAFALAGVLLFSARHLPLRIIALLLAAAVGLARVLAFRHWMSDVTASAVIGLTCAWVVSEMVRPAEVP